MNGWPWKKQIFSPIGVDIGHAYIKMVQLDYTQKQWHVFAANRCPYPPDRSPKTVATAIRRLYTEGRFKGRRVITNLPMDGLRMTSVRVSDTDLELDATEMYKGLADRFSFDLEQESIRHILAGRIHQADQTRHEVILLAANNQDIDERIHLIQESGLIPEGLDPIACALYRGYEKTLQRHEDRTQSMLFVDLGASFTNVVFAHQEHICFIKQLPMGTETIREQIATVLGVDVKEADTLRNRVQQWILSCMQDGQQDAKNLYEPEGELPVGLDRATQQMIRDAVTTSMKSLAHEIALCMRYYSVTFRGKRAERLLLSGGGADECLIQQSLQDHLGIDIDVVTPRDLLHLNKDDSASVSELPDLDSQWTVAMGLAFKGLNVACDSIEKHPMQNLVPVMAHHGEGEA